MTTPGTRPTPVRRFAELWARHPRWALALKAAVSAAIAWAVAYALPGPWSDYAYYGPLGAVVASGSTVVRSAGAAVGAVGAILVGALLGRLVDFALPPGVLAVAAAVGVGTLLAGWKRWGGLGDWVVNAALFTLVLGSNDVLGYTGAFPALVAMGALVATGVNLIAPPLLVGPSRAELDRLRDILADQLDELADGLRADQLPDEDQWQERWHEIRPVLRRATAAVDQSRESSRVNTRARRHAAALERVLLRASSLQIAAEMVDDMARHVMTWERAGRDDVAFGPAVRPAVADAFERTAAGLRAEPDGAEVAADDVRDAAQTVRAAVRAARSDDGDDYFAAGTVVLALERTARAISASAAAR
ncbi:uncharacterized membrane protein YgaE (UPF0421/DUF939 family) [Isoptericola jiangsuensis]|uniref:Uncharacterized membrane protein YgaE (UPF0421/DUF939 family) n=1 Tax=Isoptericola jiangsuensis TaxID=548579 RepID=A0A2A9EUN7_9MICO|nr:hypothetical protein [Isoptericola jiangsuensis]PFG41945.1 uncharacterized membrane protein YgaE (UPF0421/DUF939 family) [Isoptericola jiangsuensis]